VLIGHVLIPFGTWPLCQSMVHGWLTLGRTALSPNASSSRGISAAVLSAAVAINSLYTMLGHAMAHAESIRCRSSRCDAISWSSAVGSARSAPGHATGTEAVAHRDERIARGGRTTARNETGSARQGGIPFGLRQPAHG